MYKYNVDLKSIRAMLHTCAFRACRRNQLNRLLKDSLVHTHRMTEAVIHINLNPVT